MHCKARKPVVRTFLLQSWKDRLWWYFTMILSLSTRCSCYFWWDRVFERHCICFLLRWLLRCLLLLLLMIATSFALAAVAPCGAMSLGCDFLLRWGLCAVLAVTLEWQTALKWLIPLHLSQVFPYAGQFPRSWDLPHLQQRWPLLLQPLGRLLVRAWAVSNGLL